ncbi:hypothetical protein PUP68_21660 [Pseudomonas chlororaphis]|uniref:hypothetical protein n=1 Tax=Pseudomonas chlororaphis TaxID=587753 RepID=UPI00236850A7|nr:hypothetical protein [Pseudomonas chlororaphis]WDG77317.1 hypothetical protein PUP77_23200 [Pseudomonas chlororaphis]WDG83444.1 hypothetical protein PUP68_21660 [Pseudomonas chlororaphis]
MSYELWSSILKFIGYAGAVFVLVSTIGLGVVNDQLDKIKDGKIDELVIGKNALLKSVDDYKHQVEEKQKQIDDLKAKAANASRGVSKFRDFDGALRETSAGRVTLVVGGSFEESVFTDLQRLSKASKWEDLERLCTDAISKSPDWMTLYYFRGLARINQSNFDLAKSDLVTVFDNVGDSPDYAQAKDWLVKINQHLSG